MSTKEKSNVVNFPGTFSGSITNKSIKEIKEDYNREALDFIYEQLIMILDNFAYNTLSEKADERDLILVYEALASFMNRYHGLPHPMHSIVQDMFTFEDEDDMLDEQYEFDFQE